MALTEKQRAEIYSSLSDTVGQPGAEFLMAQQPPGGWEQFATKRDLADLEVKTQASFVELQASIVALNAKMDVQFAQLREQLAEQFAEIKERFAAVESTRGSRRLTRGSRSCRTDAAGMSGRSLWRLSPSAARYSWRPGNSHQPEVGPALDSLRVLGPLLRGLRRNRDRHCDAHEPKPSLSRLPNAGYTTPVTTNWADDFFATSRIA